MKDRTSIIRQSPGNSYRFPMDNNPSFSLSLFLFSQSIARVPGMRTQVPESNKTSENERNKMPPLLILYLKGELASCRRIRAG